MALMFFGGCKTEHVVKHEVDVKPIKVEPLHVTVDLNVTLRIDRQLDEFFAYEKQAAPAKPPVEPPAAPKEPGAGAGGALQSTLAGKGN